MSVPGGSPVSLGIVWLCLSLLRHGYAVKCSGRDSEYVARPGPQGRVRLSRVKTDMPPPRFKRVCPALATYSALLLCLSCSTPVPTAPLILTPAAVAAYATEVIDVLQTHSYYRDQIDWVSLRSRVAQTAAAGSSKYATVELAISLVADNHSFYQARGGPIIFPFSTPQCAENAPFPPAFSGPTDIGYVQVRATSLTGPAAVTYAQNMQADIQRQDRADLSGWIVDVRQNTGGNMWPMLAGVGPVLGEGLAGYFVDARD